MSEKLYGGVEAGGTKFICLVAGGPQAIRAEVRIDTTTPRETISQLISFFQKEKQKSRLEAIGIASFGPVDLNPDSPTWGHITTTPKAGWANTNLAGTLRDALQLPVSLDTDVNCAALGEGRWGAARGLQDYVYLTVGTGIGGGAVAGGQLVHGLIHPEMGHILIRHDLQKDPYPGCCPFHNDCWEGLASGTAMRKRWAKPAEELPFEHPAWELEAGYLAQGILNLICVLSPRRIVLGGGVFRQAQLIALVRQKVQLMLNGYIASPSLSQHIDQYLVGPGLGARAGVLGAIALAQESAR